MALSAALVRAYSCATTTEVESGSVGGGIDTSAGVTIDNDPSITGSLQITNDFGDTANSNVHVRQGDGVVVDYTPVFSATPNTWIAAGFADRLLKFTISGLGAGAIGLTNYKLGTGSGAVIIAQIDTVAIATLRSQRRLFNGAYASGSAAKEYYDKTFWKNENSGTMLAPKYRITADPDALIFQGISSTLNDTDSLGSRNSAPVGVTFVDDNIDQTGADLPAGSAQGIWWKMAVAINNAPSKSYVTSQVTFTGT